MSTTEKLERIKAKCHELLALAEKRTPGKWEIDGDFIVEAADGLPVAIIRAGHLLYLPQVTESGMWAHNAAFIAACAGSAEAGWRATIAAIEMLELQSSLGTNAAKLHADNAIAAIIAAWPEELP